MKKQILFMVALTLLNTTALVLSACSASKDSMELRSSKTMVQAARESSPAPMPSADSLPPGTSSKKAPAAATPAVLFAPKVTERSSMFSMLGTPAKGPSTPLAHFAFLYGSGVAATPHDFLTRAKQADYILIGEQHTSALHHEAQAAIVALLAQNSLTPAIGLEMIPASLQSRLALFNARKISAEELDNHLDWKNVWGFDFALYRPIFDVAEQYNIPVYGLNISHDIIKSIRKHGSPKALSAEHKGQLPPVIQYPTPAQYTKLSRFFTQHAAMLMGRQGKSADTETNGAGDGAFRTKTVAKPNTNHGAKALQRFITIQSLWDSTMAYSASQISRSGPLIILAGGAHVEYGHGIALRLQHFAPHSQSLLLMPLTHPKKIGTGEADFYYFKPPQQ